MQDMQDMQDFTNSLQNRIRLLINPDVNVFLSNGKINVTSSIELEPNMIKHIHEIIELELDVKKDTERSIREFIQEENSKIWYQMYRNKRKTEAEIEEIRRIETEKLIIKRNIEMENIENCIKLSNFYLEGYGTFEKIYNRYRIIYKKKFDPCIMALLEKNVWNIINNYNYFFLWERPKRPKYLHEYKYLKNKAQLNITEYWKKECLVKLPYEGEQKICHEIQKVYRLNNYLVTSKHVNRDESRDLDQWGTYRLDISNSVKCDIHVNYDNKIIKRRANVIYFRPEFIADIHKAIKTSAKNTLIRLLKYNSICTIQLEKWRQELWKPYGAMSQKGWENCLNV